MQVIIALHFFHFLTGKLASHIEQTVGKGGKLAQTGGKGKTATSPGKGGKYGGKLAAHLHSTGGKYGGKLKSQAKHTSKGEVLCIRNERCFVGDGCNIVEIIYSVIILSKVSLSDDSYSFIRLHPVDIKKKL